MAPAVTRQSQSENRKSVTSASPHIQVGGSMRNAKGRVEAKEPEEAECRAAMTAAQCREEDRICDVPDPIEDNGSDGGKIFCDYQDDVLHCRVAADISHAGEDLTEEEIHDADCSDHRKRGARKYVPPTRGLGRAGNPWFAGCEHVL
ncbi:hypothetical protein B0H17DRAFT_1144289 [Mycena rosella]|uniref:Uncharacterized protein n=1 Tax=Mycena rosella TaxID=1033263 RepID=A0AAD7G5V3_MYCRO|nr:hypothetical protein B0H17DRAFT_1144289 [Mycena rosella]